MSSVPADKPALRLALAFVNTYDVLSSPQDYLTVAAAGRLAQRHGLDDLAQALAAADLDELRGLRTGLYRVFAGETPGERVAALGALLDAQQTRAALVDDGGLRLAAVHDGPNPARRLGALLADALAQAMVTGGPDRFGTCVGHPCRCAYVDRTRAGRQRYCCGLCNDRMSAAAYRARAR
jgi:predicted RNA-binding Zn ribbon-like protein